MPGGTVGGDAGLVGCEVGRVDVDEPCGQVVGTEHGLAFDLQRVVDVHAYDHLELLVGLCDERADGDARGQFDPATVEVEGARAVYGADEDEVLQLPSFSSRISEA